MMRRWWLFVGFIACALPVSTASAATMAAREFALPNGLRVLLLPDSLAPAVDVALWFRAGSAWEGAGQSGASVLMEQHLNRGALADRVRRLRERGGNAGSLSTVEYATFWVTVPPASVVEALQLQAARLGGGTITASQLTSAKSAVREGQRDEGILGRALRELYAAEYAGHPYAAPLAGRPKERDAMTLANFQAWSARYAPSNAALTLVGAFNTDSVVAQLRRTVGAAKTRPVPPARIAPPKPAAGPLRTNLTGATQVPVLLSGWRAPGGTDSSRVALNVLGRLLARGVYSRLGAALTRGDTALCATVEGAFIPRREGSMLYIAATLHDAADSSGVLAVLEQQAQRLRSEPPSDAELERLKNEIELQEMGDRQTARGRAFALGSAWAVRGDWRAADLDLERLHRLTAADVRAVADRVMRIENWGAVWMWPGAVAAARSGGAK